MPPTPPEPLEAFPFVVGEARSGTTLLRVMLDAHPELSIPPESYFVSGLYPYRSRYERDDGFDLPRFAKDLRGLHKFRDWDLPEETLKWAFGQPMTGGTYPDAIRLLYRIYATAHEKPRYGDKSPGYVARMKLLVQLFPEARFVHIVRDVRSVALSLVEMPAEWGTRSVPEGAARWRHRVGRGHAEGTALGPDRYLETRYEDLVADPERELRRMLEFLLLPWDDAVLNYADRGLSRVPEGSQAIHGNVAPGADEDPRLARADVPRGPRGGGGHRGRRAHRDGLRAGSPVAEPGRTGASEGNPGGVGGLPPQEEAQGAAAPASRRRPAPRPRPVARVAPAEGRLKHPAAAPRLDGPPENTGNTRTWLSW